MRIAVVGAGVAGLTATYLIGRVHDVDLFEQSAAAGGHVRTLDVPDAAQTLALDTGFVVFNDTTYPGFTRLLRELDVAVQPGDMSFSVSCVACRLEYSSRGLPGLLAQPRNLLRPDHYRLAADILRFYRDTERILEAGLFDDATVGSYLRARRYSAEFARHYLIPLGAAIWSTPAAQITTFPLRYCLGFLQNHGLIGRGRVHQWLTVKGGARTYVDAMIRRFSRPPRLETPVLGIRRHAGGVALHLGDGQAIDYDAVVLACHADEALGLLADASHEEAHALGGFTYTRNVALLHTDGSLLPRQRRARSSWNYQTPNCRGESRRLGITYHLNRLQDLRTATDYCVTLNDAGRVAPDKIIRAVTFDHPSYTFRTLEAQRAVERLEGTRRTFFAGAHLGFGFHEDGYRSAVGVAAALGIEP